MVERLAWTQGIRIDLFERRRERSSGTLGLDRGSEERQIVEARGDPARRIAAGFELGEDRARTSNHRWRKAGKFGDRDPVAAVGGAVGDFVKQDEVALPLPRADVVER